MNELQNKYPEPNNWQWVDLYLSREGKRQEIAGLQSKVTELEHGQMTQEEVLAALGNLLMERNDKYRKFLHRAILKYAEEGKPSGSFGLFVENRGVVNIREDMIKLQLEMNILHDAREFVVAGDISFPEGILGKVKREEKQKKLRSQIKRLENELSLEKLDVSQVFVDIESKPIAARCDIYAQNWRRHSNQKGFCHPNGSLQPPFSLEENEAFEKLGFGPPVIASDLSRSS